MPFFDTSRLEIHRGETAEKKKIDAIPIEIAQQINTWAIIVCYDLQRQRICMLLRFEKSAHPRRSLR
jgi:hypothetical protein